MKPLVYLRLQNYVLIFISIVVMIFENNNHVVTSLVENNDHIITLLVENNNKLVKPLVAYTFN